MASETLKYRVEEGVAILTLHRPDKFNSFNREMALATQEALDQASADDSVRAVMITGEGKAFCAGQDLAEAIDPNGPSTKNILDEHYHPILRRIRDLEKPVVAAVNGVAAGAGANIAFACDIVIATKSASFIQAFSAIGLIPDSSGTYILPRLIGWQKASALMMLGDKVSAQDAERMGMIYRWVEDDEFREEVIIVTKRLATMPTRGLAHTKKLLQLSANNDFETQIGLEEQHQILAAQTEDYREGVNAFLEKRKPNFKGR